MARHSWVLLAVAGMALALGVVHTVWKVAENLAHPAWSAPASVNVIYFVPYAAVSGLLVGWWGWLNRRPTSSRPSASR